MKKAIILALFLFLAWSGQALALNEGNVTFTPQVSIPGSQYQTNVPVEMALSTGGIANYIQAIYTYGVGAVGIMSAIMLMLGGVIWLTSAGSSSQVEKAKTMITSSLVGMVLVLSSYLILNQVNPDLVNLKTSQIKTVVNIDPYSDGFIDSLAEAPKDLEYKFECLRSTDTCADTNPPTMQLDISLCYAKFGSSTIDCVSGSAYPQKACCGLSNLDKQSNDLFCKGEDIGTSCKVNSTAVVGTGACFSESMCGACKENGDPCSNDYACKGSDDLCGKDGNGDCNGGYCDNGIAQGEGDSCGANNSGKCLEASAYVCPGSTSSVNGGASCQSGLKCCK